MTTEQNVTKLKLATAALQSLLASKTATPDDIAQATAALQAALLKMGR